MQASTAITAPGAHLRTRTRPSFAWEKGVGIGGAGAPALSSMEHRANILHLFAPHCQCCCRAPAVNPVPSCDARQMRVSGHDGNAEICKEGKRVQMSARRARGVGKTYLSTVDMYVWPVDGGRVRRQVSLNGLESSRVVSVLGGTES